MSPKRKKPRKTRKRRRQAQQRPRYRVTTYEQFVERVCRHAPSDLLPVVSRFALAISRSTDIEGWEITPPWALAAAAKVALCFGDESRTAPVTDADVADICSVYLAMYSKEVAEDTSLGAVESTLGRIAYEQFPYQESIFEEVARTRALFVEGLADVPTKIITTDALRGQFGASIENFVGVAFLLHAAAHANEGRFNVAWLDRDNMSEINAEIPKEVTARVVREHFAVSINDFRVLASEPPPHPLLPQTAYNPLQARPFIDMGGGELLAPQPSFILRRASPGGIYYDGLNVWGSAFTDDLGLLFEHYIGRQCRTLPGAHVLPEVVYDRGRQKSIDWFVLYNDLTLLVEVKTTRLPLGARAGTEDLPAMVQRTLGKAFDQIGRTVACLANGTPEFAAIPRGQPIVAIAVTLEPYYMANTTFVRRHLPEPTAPVIVASAREFEMLVAYGEENDIPALLHEVVADEDQRSWNLGSVLSRRHRGAGRNRILDESYNRLPWSDPRPGRSPATEPR